MMKINIRHFYLVGAFLFLIGMSGGVWNLTMLWSVFTTSAKIQTIAGLLFNCILIILFAHLYKTTPDPVMQINENKLHEELKKYMD